MKQLLQNLKTGESVVADVPAPLVQPGRVLVRTAASLISTGTERTFVELARKSVVGKAQERPDLVRKTIESIRNDGLVNTVHAVREKLNESHALGYSAAGIVLEVGADVVGFRAGDAVACAGTGYATHAEVVSVPKNLCVRLPSGVDFESGAFAALGAIAMQGLRLAEPTLGESVVVIGLGLVGQLTIQLLKANGCRVFGIDLDESRIDLARTLGAEAGSVPESAEQAVNDWSLGRGADAVIITAGTSSNEPVELAGEISRLKGRVVIVGSVAMNVPRNSYYQKELTLKVSRSYGPGRYDPEYEEHGHDYPIAQVRWSEGRNIEAFLNLIDAGSVKIQPLITHRIPIEEGDRVYKLIAGKITEPYLGIVLQYNIKRELERSVDKRPRVARPRAEATERVRVGMIGAGSYAQKFLLPNLKNCGAEFCSITTASGVTARDVGERYGFSRIASGAEEVIRDPDVNLVVIATRHDSHAELATRALAGGASVFVEKPLAMNDAQLEDVLKQAANARGQLMVGFNRRFSPLGGAAKDFFSDRRTPLSIVYRVNAGRVPASSWIQDEREGGGRIVGEICHFVDLMQFWTGALVTRVYAESVASNNDAIVSEDSTIVSLRFADGSNGTIAYLAEGDAALQKERVEIFGAGKTFVLDDFRAAEVYENGRLKRIKLRKQDKGQADEVRAVCAIALSGETAPITIEELAATSRATFRIRESLRTGRAVDV